VAELIFEEDNRQAFALLDRAYEFFGQGPMVDFLDAEWSQIMQTAARRRFTNEASESDGAWAQLRPATNKFRVRQGFPPEHPINQRTGEMRRYLDTATIDYRASDGLVTATWPEKASGELLHKLQVAQGASSRRGDQNTPARPVLDATEDNLDELATRLLRDFGRAVR
jgi:hypothetical protein